MFQFTRLSSFRYVFTEGYLDITPGGLSHSEIPGSKIAYISPGLIAVCHVLHQLLVPGHPLCALNILVTSFGFARLLLKYLIFKELNVMEMAGIEPAASCVQSRRSPIELHPLAFHANYLIDSYFKLTLAVNLFRFTLTLQAGYETNMGHS